MTNEEKKGWDEFIRNVANRTDLLIEKIIGVPIKMDQIIPLLKLQLVRNPDSALNSENKDLLKMINEFVDENLRNQIVKNNSKSRQYFQAILKSLNQSIAFGTFMTLLWYSKLPCFDVEGITSEENGEKGILKACYWKGKRIPCSAIFKKVATDNGICCAFNMQVSISSTFYEQIVHRYSCAKKLQSQTVTIEKHCIILLYE